MYIVLVDMRENNGKIVPLMDDGEILQFETFNGAEEVVLKSRFASTFPIKYVDMDE